jgi:peptidoglycan/LPS O-acetylase OafA/YrhL
VAAGTPSTTSIAPAAGGGVDRDEPPEFGVGYRPALDGIRAVAVYLGVAFHAAVHGWLGGFIGVDMFFVLSGYLVTQLLIRDIGRSGSVSLLRFYSRRIRRLLPAAATALFATIIVFNGIAAPAELEEGMSAIRAAALHVSNWFFISQSVEYFGADLQSNPVVQYWSLSVEEQFYLAWPLALTGLNLVAHRFGRFRWTFIQGVVLVVVLTSFVAALLIAPSNLDRAYYGTDTRVYQLLGGGLLALSPGVLVRMHRITAIRRSLPYVAAGALAGIIILGSDLFSMPPIDRGAATAVLTLTLIASVDVVRSGPVHWFLSRPAVVYLGKISYGTYLWHWLVIVVTVRVVDVSPVTVFMLSALIATGLAALSYEIIEKPIRSAPRLDRRRGAVVVVGLSISAVMGLVVAPRILDPDRDREPVEVAQGTSVGATPVPEDLDWEGAQQDVPDFPTCTPADVDPCTIVRGPGPHLLLLGDSHARMYLPLFEEIAEERGLTLSAAVAPACPWQAGLQYLQDPAACIDHQDNLYPGVVDALDPDIVVVANRSFDDPVSPLFVEDQTEGRLPPTSQEYLDSVAARTDETLEIFRAAGRQVLIMEPIPVAPRDEDPVICLSAAEFIDECRYVATAEPTSVEQIYTAAAEADDGVWAIDLDRSVCPYFQICDPIVDQLIVKRDTSHLTASFARTLADEVEQFLDDNGLLSA